MAKTPTAAISTDSGEATPPPLPDALITPTTSGITKADEKTGPMNPTDCAITSGSVSTFAPRRSYACSCLAIAASLGWPDRTDANDLLSRFAQRRRLVRQPPAERADPGGLVDELRRLHADRGEAAGQLARHRSQRLVQVGDLIRPGKLPPGPAHVLQLVRPPAAGRHRRLQRGQVPGGTERVEPAPVPDQAGDQPRVQARAAEPQVRATRAGGRWLDPDGAERVVLPVMVHWRATPGFGPDLELLVQDLAALAERDAERVVLVPVPAHGGLHDEPPAAQPVQRGQVLRAGQ